MMHHLSFYVTTIVCKRFQLCYNCPLESVKLSIRHFSHFRAVYCASVWYLRVQLERTERQQHLV